MVHVHGAAFDGGNFFLSAHTGLKKVIMEMFDDMMIWLCHFLNLFDSFYHVLVLNIFVHILNVVRNSLSVFQVYLPLILSWCQNYSLLKISLE